MRYSIFRKSIIYALPLLFLIIPIFVYLNKPVDVQQTEKYHLEILEDLTLKLDLFIGGDVNDFEVFKDTFLDLMPFSGIYEYRKISFISSLKSKCLKSEFLSTTEEEILNKFNTLFSDTIHPTKTNLITTIAYISAITFFITILFLIRKIKHKELNNILTLVLALSFSINIIFIKLNNSNLKKIKPSLIECFQKNLSENR